MIRKTFFILTICMGLSVRAQQKQLIACSVAFYNLENLFDTIPGANDTEYTPQGATQWNTLKYKSKLSNMAFTISKLGIEKGPVGPAFIGVSEIENRSVLEDLVKEPAIASRNYQIVHYDSPDARGIDVGLLYNPKLFTFEASQSRTLKLADKPTFKTRDQLVVRGRIFGELFHVVVNHWPSRRGGEDNSSPLREAAARLTRTIVDSVQKAFPESKIIVMGDLNDDPFNKSLTDALRAVRDPKDATNGNLYNPFWAILDGGIGSLAYKGQWNLFDQIIINDKLIGKDRSTLKFWNAEVFNRDFLKQEEGQYKGYPKRTHAGGVWLNGYSDHFPTLIYLVKEK